MTKLFSYGTLQQENVQKQTFQRKLDGERDVLVGYVIGSVKITDRKVIEVSGSDTHPILTFTGNSDDTVEGTVFEVTEEELIKADSYEVEQYQRIAEDLESGETAWIYVDAQSVQA